MRILGVEARAERVVEVDGVLGQHGDQRENRDREAARDVFLRSFGSPREHERRGHDGGAEHDEAEHRMRCEPRDSKHDRGECDRDAEGKFSNE